MDLPPTERGIPDDGTPFSDDPVEHTTLSATFMVMIMVTWLIFGHKIQGMFSWCDALYIMAMMRCCSSSLGSIMPRETHRRHDFTLMILQDQVDL